MNSKSGQTGAERDGTGRGIFKILSVHFSGSTEENLQS
jgi:hypothetical protein